MADLAARARQSWHIVLIAGVVGITLLYFSIFQRGSAKMTTAGHMRQIKSMLEAYEGQSGGFPATLGGLERRGIMLPTHVLKDAWGREIGYTPSRPLGVPPDLGEPVYRECELRSAGPNGEAGDADDMVWNGVASGR